MTERVRIVEKPVVVEVEKIVYKEVEIEKPIQVTVVKEVEKIIHVPTEVIKFVEVEKQIEKIKEVYTNVTNDSIFDVCPFIVKQKHGSQNIAINHFNVMMNFLRGSKTFGESKNLRKLIKKN